MRSAPFKLLCPVASVSAVLLFSACGGPSPTLAQPILVPLPSAPSGSSLPPPALDPSNHPRTATTTPADDAPLDFGRAPRVPIKVAPAKAGAPRPIGARPAKQRFLKELSKVKDGSALERADAPSTYNPKLPYEFHQPPADLPPGARRDVPLAHAGSALTVISESGGRLLLVYGNRHVAIVEGKRVEQIVDFDPPELPLSDLDRHGSDVHQVVYHEGVLFACRGYNAWFPTRKGIVTAVDAATGELRWRSEPKVCGGSLAIVDEYVITGYGAHDTPYALKLLRSADGTLAQSLTLFGAALEFAVSGSKVIAMTYKHRVEYELQP